MDAVLPLPGSVDAEASRAWVVFTILASCLYMVAVIAAAFANEAVFGNSAYDFGIHVQAVWKLSRFRGLFNTIRGLVIWGDHLWLVLPVYALPYRILPSPYTLLFLQTLAIAAGVPAVFRIARSFRIGDRAACFFSLAYLLYPPTTNMAMDNFHPEVAAVAFLLWSIASLRSSRNLRFWFFLVLALMCKEDVAIPVFLWGFVLLLGGRRRTGLATMVVAAAWFAISLSVLLPLSNGKGFFRFSGGYWFSGFAKGWYRPDFYAGIIFDRRTAVYLLRLLAPFAFMPLFSPLVLLPAFGPAAVNLLSGNGYLMSAQYHYEATIIPFVMLASISAWARYGRRTLRYAGAAVSVSLLLGISWYSTFPFRFPDTIRNRLNAPDVRSRRAAIALVAPDRQASVSASHLMVTKLAHRDEIYMFPNPWVPSYWGIDGEGYPIGTLPQYVVVDRSETGAENEALLGKLESGGLYETVFREGSTLVLMRRGRTDPGG